MYEQRIFDRLAQFNYVDTDGAPRTDGSNRRTPHPTNENRRNYVQRYRGEQKKETLKERLERSRREKANKEKEEEKTEGWASTMTSYFW